jgi:YidC/Oxa1 family membrane protein insertase
MFNTDQKRAFIAVLLSGIVLFGWQHFFAPKTVPPATTSNEIAKKEIAQEAKDLSKPAASDASLAQGTAAAPIEPVTIKPFTLKRDNFAFTINNDLTVVDMKNPNSVFDFNGLSGSASPLKLQVVTDYGPLDLFFDLAQVDANKVTGSNLNYGVNFEAFIKENGRVSVSFTSTKAYKYRLVFDSKEKKLDNGQARHFSVYTNKLTTFVVTAEEEKEGNIKWVGTDFNFHLFAFVFSKETPARYKTNEKGQMYVEVPELMKSFSGDLVFTKKNYDELISLGDNLHLSVDFGFFAILAVPFKSASVHLQIYP